MNREELRQSLRQPYDRDNWSQLVRSVFGSHTQLNAQAKLHATEDDDSIKSIAEIGSVLLDDGRNLAIIEVEVGDDVNLLRNRVSLRNRVAKFIDQDRAHGVLAVFSSSNPEYRFSFTARETIFDEELGIVDKETATKRFTYVLGPGETCNTAAERFERLSQKTESINLNDVVEAFSVEKLNKEFFNTYKDHYEHFCSYLLADQQRDDTYRIFDIPKKRNAAEQTRLEKPVRDFVKRLLGRIVFLHFLQKKGWMGCPADREDWSGGDPDFLRNYFQQSDEPGHFHSDRLVPLFYGALNTPGREHDVFAPTGTRIPYLNGGLFESMLPDETVIDFPAAHFEALLDFFGQYNFTIDENDPDEHEVGIDPEMLGHIFENLLEDNKDKGAYYTPKAIVHYMCQQSLIYYLHTHLEQGDGAREALEYLVRNKQIGEGTPHANWIKNHAAEIERLLDAMKVCDPAIGSGAFPIGLLQEIFWLKLTLDLTLNDPGQLAEIKRGIIQNSIYGVDKDAGAVDIARLRFWLSLVVDEERPRALPNLDYKIMQGDSLLESYEGVALDHIMDPKRMGGVTIHGNSQVEMDFASGQMQLTADEKSNLLAELMRAYFTAETPEKKQALHRDIDAFVLQHIDYNLALAEEAFEIELHQHRAEIRRKEDQLASFKPTKKTERRMQWLEKSIADLGDKRKRLEKLEHQAERPYFLWHLFFQDVFARGGFDIVIANPPYVSANEHKKAAGDSYRNEIKEHFQSATKTWDLYVPFFELSCNLARIKGTVCLITPNKYLSAPYGFGLRNYIRNNQCLLELLDVSRLRVFENVSVYPVISILKNDSKPGTIICKKLPIGSKYFNAKKLITNEALPEHLDILPDHIWGFLISDSFDILLKMASDKRVISDYFTVQATTTAAEADAYTSSITEDSADSWKLVNTGTIDPFTSLWGIKALTHQGEKFFCPTIPKNSSAVSSMRNGIFNSAKLLFAKMAKHFEGFVDDDGTYAGVNINCFHSPQEPVELHALCAYCHSSSFNFLYDQFYGSLKMSGGYLPFQAPLLKTIPIPEIPEDSNQGLAELAKLATTAQGKDLIDIKNKIDHMVYDLFKLNQYEARVIESFKSTSAQTSSDKLKFFTLLRQLAEERPYLAFTKIKDHASCKGILDNENTLYDYLREAVENGIVGHAGRGWYTRHPKPALLSDATIEELKTALSERFPLLPHYLWSPLQFNPWLHHQLGRAPAFVYVENDGALDMAEFLRDEGWEVAINPGKRDPGPSNRGRDVVLRELRREIEEDEPSIETALVDLYMENTRFQLMDEAEYREMVHKILADHRLDLARLLRLLGDRKKEISDILSEESTQYLGIF